MAERITKIAARRPKGRPTLYPWAEWTDGSAWRIRRGADFHLPARRMESLLRTTGSTRGLRTAVRVIDDETIEFQFTPFAEETAA